MCRKDLASAMPFTPGHRNAAHDPVTVTTFLASHLTAVNHPGVSNYTAQQSRREPESARGKSSNLGNQQTAFREGYTRSLHVKANSDSLKFVLSWLQRAGNHKLLSAREADCMSQLLICSERRSQKAVTL